MAAGPSLSREAGEGSILAVSPDCPLAEGAEGGASRLLRQILPQLLHLGEEAVGFRAVAAGLVLVAGDLEFLQQLDLPLGTVKAQLFRARYLLGNIINRFNRDDI